MITIYGIRNCDTMKKAMAWLDGQGIAYRFHDYRKDGAPEQKVRDWIDRLGWEQVINRRGTTWRKLPEATRAAMDADAALREALASPSLIRRPVLEADDRLLIGFQAEDWSQALA